MSKVESLKNLGNKINGQVPDGDCICEVIDNLAKEYNPPSVPRVVIPLQWDTTSITSQFCNEWYPKISDMISMVTDEYGTEIDFELKGDVYVEYKPYDGGRTYFIPAQISKSNSNDVYIRFITLGFIRQEPKLFDYEIEMSLNRANVTRYSANANSVS